MRYHLMRLVFLLFILLFTLKSVAFPNLDSSRNIINIKKYSVEDGLASREIFCAIQDDDGFMWFGTRNGLNRYDGKQFKLFTKQNNGLAENKIIQIAKDTKKRLILLYGHPGYARNVKGMEVLDLKTHKLMSLKEAYPNLPFDEEYVYWATNDGADVCFLTCQPYRYWRLTKKGFVLQCEMKAWDKITPTKETWKTKNGAYHTGTGRICIFKQFDAALFLSDEYPIYLMSNHQLFEEKASSINKGIVTITPEHEFILDENDLTYKLSYLGGWTKRQFQFYPSKFEKASDVYIRHDNQHNLFCYTNEAGFYLYDHNLFQKIFSFQQLNKIEDRNLYEVYCDRQANKWVCTSDGLFKVSISKNPFIHYVTKSQLHDSSENQVRGIYVDEKKNVYANVWTNIYKNNDRIFSGNNDIKYSICQHLGNIIVGSYFLCKLVGNNKQIITNISTDDFGEIWAMDSLNSNELLLGCTKKLCVYNVRTDSISNVKYINEKIPKATFTYRFIKRKDRNIIAVSQNGLYLLDKNAKEVIKYWGKQATTVEAGIALPFENILDAYEDPNNILWVATNGDGLYRCDIAKHQFQQFNITAGFPSDILYRIEADEFDNLWISTDNGLAKFNTKNFKVKTYTTDNGISHNEFNRISSYKAKDGMILFGGLDGVNAFYPKDFTGDTSDAIIPMRIISYTKFSGDQNKIVDLTDDLLASNNIQLDPDDRFFNLEFQLIDFQEGKLSYAYKVEGFDKDWNYINENSIRISGLPYGDFQLHIKGQTHKGQWSKNELIIPLHNKAPLYKHTWFTILAILTILAIFIRLFRWRTKRLVERKNALERTVALRTEELKKSLVEKEVLLKEIHHRVKNNLQVISSLLELQSAGVKDPKAKEALMASQSRVQNIALIHHKLYQTDNLSMVEFKAFILDLFHQLNAVYMFGRSVEIKVLGEELQLEIDIAIPLGLILNELLTNSFKYATSGLAHSIFSVELIKPQNQDDFYRMHYSDQGPGLPKEFKLSHSNTLGMKAIHLLARQLGGKVVYSNKDGAVFDIYFLIHKQK